MYPLLIVVVFTMVMVWQAAIGNPQQVHLKNIVTADVVAINFWSYQKAVTEYLAKNPGISGTVNDELLTFETGYLPKGIWSHVVENKTLYLFSNSPVAIRASKKIRDRGRGAIIGIAQEDGSLRNMSGSASVYVLPAAIPNGAIVVIGH